MFSHISMLLDKLCPSLQGVNRVKHFIDNRCYWLLTRIQWQLEGDFAFKFNLGCIYFAVKVPKQKSWNIKENLD